jgi:hypothetical protein
MVIRYCCSRGSTFLNQLFIEVDYYRKYNGFKQSAIWAKQRDIAVYHK